jgi:hypothetical protein
MRLHRWERLRAEFPDLETLRVLNLGGSTLYWTRSPV